MPNFCFWLLANLMKHDEAGIRSSTRNDKESNQFRSSERIHVEGAMKYHGPLRFLLFTDKCPK
jgi:hypothetical protein